MKSIVNQRVTARKNLQVISILNRWGEGENEHSIFPNNQQDKYERSMQFFSFNHMKRFAYTLSPT
ncbi:MAG: hypothetical protein ABW104_20345, partial [Candidatus Thiodiazotropha sp. 6PLUC2]